MRLGRATSFAILCLAVGAAAACFGGGDGDSGEEAPDSSKIPTATLPAPLPEVRVLGESAVSTGGRRTYTIRSGDTLSAVADRFGVTLEDLLAANPGIDPTGLVAGDVDQPAGECVHYGTRADGATSRRTDHCPRGGGCRGRGS